MQLQSEDRACAADTARDPDRRVVEAEDVSVRLSVLDGRALARARAPNTDVMTRHEDVLTTSFMARAVAHAHGSNMRTPIIAFSKDWHEDPTSNHHVLRELARTRRVLWLNSTGTRRPKMRPGRDLGKVRRRLSELSHGPVNVEADLWVATPLVLPLPHSAITRQVNRQIVRLTVRALRARLEISSFHLWSFLPNVADYIGTFGEDLSVYYCVDELPAFAELDAVATQRAERRLLERVDVTFATSVALADAKSATCRRTYHAPHGVDHALFAQALLATTSIPDDLAALPRPRIGFFGPLRPFLDYELLVAIARARPQWSLALLGQEMCDLSAIRDLPNVHLLGHKPHELLPAYGRGFDVGLVPYRIDELVKYMSPLKLREYLAAGVPVVSTAMPEVVPYSHLCHVACTVPDTIAAIERALGEGDPAARAARSQAIASETWVARVAALSRVVDAAQRRKEALPDAE
jgi:glycosyltransferase involved in cell wall biosynthesis